MGGGQRGSGVNAPPHADVFQYATMTGTSDGPGRVDSVLLTRRLRAGALALVLMALSLGCRLIGAAPVAAADAGAKPLPPLARRDFVRHVRLTGLTEATRSYVVTTPLLAGGNQGSLVITKLVPAGSSVKVGDVLVEFDRQNQDKQALDKKAEYDDLVQQIAQKKAEQDAAVVKDQSEIAQAANAVKKYELEVLKNEMLSRIKAEQNDQDLDEARAKLAALKTLYDIKRAAAAADLRILEIKRDRAKATMEHAQANAQAMTVLAPIPGLVVPRVTWRGNGPTDIQEGDEMWPGAPVLQVVNQASMLVRVRVNQADLPFVRAGQPAIVHLDAYPDLTMQGRVDQIAPIGVKGSFSNRLREFTALVSVEGSNARLLPDLTAAIDVEVDRVKNALVVPRAAIERDGQAARVHVRDGSGVTSRQVTLGPADEVDVVVTAGLQPGEVVVQ
jgi:HlyD family secretion protein